MVTQEREKFSMFSNVCVSEGVLTQFPGWAAGLDILIRLRYGPEMSSANHKNISLDWNFEDILSCEGEYLFCNFPLALLNICTNKSEIKFN